MNNTAKKLKSSIKQLVEKKVRATRERVEYKRNASPEFKQSPEYQHWFGPFDEIRSDIKHDIRHHLLAYALMRGRPYKTVERKCAEDNKPWASSIERILEYHKDFEAIPESERVQKLMGDVQGWLDAEPAESPPEAAEVAA